MVKRLLELFNKEISGLHEAAYLLGGFAFLSQILALVRDRLLAGTFGAGADLDAYYAAFRIPDAIFVTIASLVSASIIIPYIFERLKRGELEAKKFVNGVFSGFLVIIISVSILVFILTPELVRIAFPGFRGTEMEKLISDMTRIMLLQPVFLGISSYIAGITQAFRKFFVYALSPILYNGGIIVGVVLFYPRLGMEGLAWGVVLGAVLHLLIQLPALIGTGLAPTFIFRIDWREIFNVITNSFPRTIGLAAGNLSMFALVALGSVVGAGSISVFTLSWNLQSVPLSIVGSSYSMAAFPTLSRLFSIGKNEEFALSVRESIKHIIFWSMPVLFLFIVLRAQIVRTVLGFGEFDWSDTRLTAASLALFALSVVAQSLIILLSRAYYAAGRTGKPLFANLLGAFLAVFLAWFFMRLIGVYPGFEKFLEALLKVEGTGGARVLALPLGYSLASITNVFIIWKMFKTDFPSFDSGLSKTFLETAGASVSGSFVSYLVLDFLDEIFSLEKVSGVFMQGFFAGLVGISFMILVLWLMRNREFIEIVNALKRRIWRVETIGPDIADNPTL